MPDTTKYKSVAVPLADWKELMAMARPNHRSAGGQISFLINVAKDMPSDTELLEYFKGTPQAKQNSEEAVRIDLTPEGLEESFQKSSQAAQRTLDGIPEDVQLWILFRTAVEFGAKTCGVENTAYFMTRLLAETNGIIAGDENAGYHNAMMRFSEPTDLIPDKSAVRH